MPFYSRFLASPSSASPAPTKRMLILPMLFALALVLIPGAASAQCNGYLSAHTPASGPPPELWGDLQPTDTGSLPGNRDNTDFNEKTSWLKNPYYQSLDVENGWMFVAASQRFQVWDANADPGKPFMKADIPLTNMDLTWGADAHAFIIFHDVDAPTGRDDVTAMVGWHGTGLVVFNTANRNNPSILYQDHGPGNPATRKADGVYATTIGGRAYAFMAAEGTGGGLHVYDLDAAKKLTTRCTEGQPGNTQCPGVYKGRLGTRESASFVDGAGNYVAFASKGAAYGVEIWDVSSPSSPRMVMDGLSFGKELYWGVALWQQGNKFYLAGRQQRAHKIYDVSCITKGGTCSPKEIWSRVAISPAESGLGTVTYSNSDGTPYLYWGAGAKCPTFPQSEWLEDVSNPAAPRDVAPQHTANINGETETYWSWYYRKGGSNGFNHISPKAGKFYKGYFYRAAKGIVDVHKQTGALPPIADFSWSPELIYPGTDVTFTDTSTGQPIAWDWSFSPDGNPSFSSQKNATASFSSTGTKTVTLEVTNLAGSDQINRNLVVSPPEPAVSLVSVNPSPALVCQPITFTAEGVTGEPPLTYSWQLFDSQDQLVDTGGNSDTFVWDADPQVVTAGESYTAEVTISNASGTIQRKSAPVTVAALPDLPAELTFSPTYAGFPNNPSNGNVDYSVSVPGATEWRWNFDVAGGAFGPWSNDPVSGPAPTHNYTEAGTYQVQVEVRNCVEVARASSVLAVTVDNITPLEAQFAATGIFCFNQGCFADTGQEITFSDQSTGEPDFYDYDWDGNGGYEDASNTSPVTSHTYKTAGEYQPKLRIRRGNQSSVYTHPTVIVSAGGGGGNLPTIAISGLTNGTVDQAMTFTATASDCTPNPSGWTWRTAGGTISGASSGSRITVSWGSAGSKQLQVENSSCGTATGSRRVSITSGGGGGGGVLKASIRITPALPGPGDVVTFDGTSSGGSPTGYTWTIDGKITQGSKVTETFSQPGNYLVKLEVSKPDNSCPFGICTDTATTTLAVGAGANQLLASFGVNIACFGNLCSVEAGQPIEFTDTSTGPINGREWNFGDGTTSTDANPVHSWDVPGLYPVTLNILDGEGGSAQAQKTFEVTPGQLKARFTSDRPCVGGVCTVARNQTVEFTDQSSGEVTNYQWAFGDGSTSTATNPTQKWGQSGLYTVILTVSDGQTEDSTSMLFQVEGPPPVVASFASDAACSEAVCEVETLDSVQFVDNSDGELTSWSWDFGDGSTSDQSNPSHVWTAPGDYTVTLTVSDGEQTDNFSQAFKISGLPVGHNSVLLPWVVQGQGALNQASKLYIHNADSQARTLLVRFYRRPAAGDDIPEVGLDLAPGATAYYEDVMAELFGLDNVTGSIEIEPADLDSKTPVVTGFHQTFQDDGTAFGQGVPGVRQINLPKAGPDQNLHLIGLNDNENRFGFFGITNPNDSGVKFKLHFFNRRGERIGDLTDDEFVVARLGQRQFQINQIRNAFGIRDEVDYRVEVELLTSGRSVYTYGTNLRTGTEDPSFVRAGEPTASRVYLLGALATQGLNNTQWQTDALVANVNTEMATTVLTYTSAGNNATPYPQETLTLLPGESKRLRNVLVDRWQVENANGLGVLVFESDSDNGIYPIIQGETYDNANPNRRFGQFVAPLTDENIARAGQRQVLAGLQQDSGVRSTIWVYNPGDTLAEYDLIYRGLDGQELGAIEGYRVRPQRLRQISPSVHALPEGGVEGGFTVQIVVRSGELLSAAQVVNSANNDPSYVTGATR